MSLKNVGIILAIVGGLVGLIFILADVIGISTDPNNFGPRQTIGTIAGIAILVVGIVVYVRAGRNSTPE